MPLIARWPKVIPEGSTCDALVGLNDLMATFAELADAKLSDHEAPRLDQLRPASEQSKERWQATESGDAVRHRIRRT